MYYLHNISSFSMNRPWNIVLFTVAIVGCAGLAGLVGFMVAKQMAGGSTTTETASTASSTASTVPSKPGKMSQEMTPAQQRAQNPKGPWLNDLVIARSTDGVSFGDSFTIVEEAGVPSMTRGTDGTLYLAFQWFPSDDDASFDKVAVKTSSDNGATWTDPTVVTIDGFPEAYVYPFDPTIVQGADGLIHLFFTTRATKAPSDEPFISSATSTDGIHYTWQDGARMDVTDEPNIDSAAAYMGTTWHLMTPRSPDVAGVRNQAFHAASADGVSFSDPVMVTGSADTMNWTGNLLAQDSTLWFYGSGANGAKLWRSSSTDGAAWSAPESLTVEKQGGDPAIVQTATGDYLLVVVALPEVARE